MKNITSFKTVVTPIVLIGAAIALGIPSLVAIKTPKAFLLKHKKTA